MQADNVAECIPEQAFHPDGSVLAYAPHADLFNEYNVQTFMVGQSTCTLADQAAMEMRSTPA